MSEVGVAAAQPIRSPFGLQSHGALCSCRGPSFIVQQASENIASHIGIAAQALLGRPLVEHFDVPSVRSLAAALEQENLREANPLGVVTRKGRSFDAVLHRPSGFDRVIVELEPRDEALAQKSEAFDRRLRAGLLRLQKAHDVRQLCNIAALEVRELTGFDRVMVYRFDDDWNGEVVAEAKAQGLEPYIGLHFPASDVPEKARRLHSVNWLRFIPDVDYTPSLLFPHDDPELPAPLDLSQAALRGVSSIHLEYLRNMGATASMTVSIIKDGELAGLVACHHYSGPKSIPCRVRDTAEFIGRALSWQLGVLEQAEAAEELRHVQQTGSELIRSIVNSNDLADGLGVPALLSLTAADGAAIVLQDGVRRLGQTPSLEPIAEIVEWLRQRSDDVFATDRLPSHLGAANEWSDAAPGLIAVAIARDLGEYLLWFRRPIEHTAEWGESWDDASAAGPVSRLTPRGSFEFWRQAVRGRSLPWRALHVEAAASLRGTLLGGVRKRAVELRAFNQRLLDADRAKDAFIAAVSHELRTPLNAITGWAHLLQSGALPSEKWPQAVEVISRNARLQAQIVDDLLDVSRITSGKLTLNVESVDLNRVIDEVLQSSTLSIEAKGLRVKRALDPSASPVLGDATRLRQIFLNLITNAVKFTPKDGSITVVLMRQRSDVELSVTDSGQGIAPDLLPHVFEAFRQADGSLQGLAKSTGLGLGLTIVRKLAEMHGGTVSAESTGEGAGATFRVRLPMAPLALRMEHENVPSTPPAYGSQELGGLTLLVVEDESDAREMLVHVLGSCGARVVASATAMDALEQLDKQAFDLVISDIGLPQIDGLQLMRIIREREKQGRRTPAIALTAYTRGVDRTRALQAGFNAHVPKPIDANELVTVVASTVGRLP